MPSYKLAEVPLPSALRDRNIAARAADIKPPATPVALKGLLVIKSFPLAISCHTHVFDLRCTKLFTVVYCYKTLLLMSYMDEVFINEHAFKHGVSQKDIEYAWENFYKKQYRGAPHEGEIVLIGPDTKGRPIQVVAAERLNGTVIYHAMRPPTRNVLMELGLKGRRA